MKEFKIYSVSDDYINYLRQFYPNVYSNKVDKRIHTRKYVGIVLKISNYNYYVPMSSPKDTDYQIAGDK
ncbi:MAG: type III toxin-antitoxin system ToxN/AbiQ family toxin [Lachnospiraceae bacterium]|nr:type III toxin-antitoxin system ToxN/AbiQ family toxin [Lachnospiraceae bacterium]